LSKLEKLGIENTDLSSGIEHLPDSLSNTNQQGKKKIFYSTKERPQSKIKEIAWQLDLFTNKTQKQ